MKRDDLNLLPLARRHWRYLAPTWLTPAVVMVAIVVEDITHSPVPGWVDLLVIFPCMIAGTISAGLLHSREHLPWGVFYFIWLAPMMVVWCFLVCVRGTILTLLGRPL